jgi:hypothetical protein
VNDVVIIILLIIVGLLAMFFIPQLLVIRAVPKVIKMFRRCNAVNPGDAKTTEELGFKPETMLTRMMKPRDYRPRALQFLISQGIIKTTEDGKMYLSEETLGFSRWRST